MQVIGSGKGGLSWSDSVVAEMAPHGGPQPAPLRSNRFMHLPMQFELGRLVNGQGASLRATSAIAVLAAVNDV